MAPKEKPSVVNKGLNNHVESHIDGNKFHNEMENEIMIGDKNIENSKTINVDENLQRETMVINGELNGNYIKSYFFIIKNIRLTKSISMCP